MASAGSSVNLEYLATFRNEFVELLLANQPHINLDHLQSRYSKHFKRDLTFRKYGIESVGYLMYLLRDVVDVVTVKSNQYLTLREPASISGSANDFPGAKVTRSLSDGAEPSSQSNKTDTALARERDALADLRKDLVGLLQSSPKGHIEVPCLLDAYRKKYKRVLQLADYGITTVESFAGKFRDTLEVVNQCSHIRHQHIRLTPDLCRVTQQNRGAVQRTRSNDFQENLKHLLRAYPRGLKLNVIGKIYQQMYCTYAPNKRAIRDACNSCKDDFEFFSKCQTPNRQFLRLRSDYELAGHCQAVGGGRASDVVPSSGHRLPPVVFNTTGSGASSQAAQEVSCSPPSVWSEGVAAGGISIGGSESLAASNTKAATSPVPSPGLDECGATDNPATQPGQGLCGPLPGQQSQGQQSQGQQSQHQLQKPQTLPLKESTCSLAESSAPKQQPECRDDAVRSSADKQRAWRSAPAHQRQWKQEKAMQVYQSPGHPEATEAHKEGASAKDALYRNATAAAPDTGSLSTGSGFNAERRQACGRFAPVGDAVNEVRKDLVELLQSSPEGHIELKSLPRVYAKKYHRALYFAEWGTDSIADKFGDILEVVNQCSHSKHQLVRNKPERAASLQNRASSGHIPSGSFQEELKELLRDYPDGLKIKAIGKKYVKKYTNKHTPKNKVLKKLCMDKFEVFSMCDKPSRQFVRLKPGHHTSSHQFAPVFLNKMGSGISSQAGLQVFCDPPAGGTGISGSGSQGASQCGASTSAVPSPSLGASAESEVPPTPPAQRRLGPVLGQQSQAKRGKSTKLPLKKTAVGLGQQGQKASVPKGQPVRDGRKIKKKKLLKVPLTESAGRDDQKKCVLKAQAQCRDNAVPSSTDKQQKRPAPAQLQEQQCKKPRQERQPPHQPHEHVIISPSLSWAQSRGSRQQAPSLTTLDAAAQTHIHNLAAANELVTVAGVVELLKQQFQAGSLQSLGLRYESQLPALNQLMRLQSKVNAFIQAFVHVRAICTLHELKEFLAKMDALNGPAEKRDYADLHLGPLSKQPLVYEYFRFPPTKDDGDIPEITTLDVLEMLKRYMTKHHLWTCHISLQHFMQYVAEAYDVEGLYDVGLRIQSVALFVAALKTAQRKQKPTMDRALDNLRTSLIEEVTDTTERIRQAVMSPADMSGHRFGPGPELEVRRRYCSMTAADAVNAVFNNAYKLMAYSQPLRQFCPLLRRVVMDGFSRSLFQLAICSGGLGRPDDLPGETLNPADEREEESGPESEKNLNKSKPTEDEVCEEVQRYVERIQHGNVNLKDLARIETKLCRHFSFRDFVSLSRAGRTFLEFLALDHPAVLESVGGTLTGLVSGNPSQSSVYRPSRMDLVEFIRQCDPCKESLDTLDICLRAHYRVSNVEELGHGPANRLSQQIRMASQMGQHEGRNAVIYETALCAPNRRHESKHRDVGLLGPQSLESALACLASAPLLEDLAEWSHWSMVFEPEHGNLKAFLETNPGQSVSPPIEINALEVRPGTLLQLATDTSPDHFSAAAKRGDAVSAVGHLASLVAKEGLACAPLALLGNHMETALNILGLRSEGAAANGFVLDCLLAVPLLIGEAVVRQVILNPLTAVVGSEVKSRQLLLEACHTTAQRTKIQRMGLLLGISQWKDGFTNARMPRNIDKEDDDGGHFLGNEDNFDFSSLFGMSKAPTTTEAAESSTAPEISSDDTPALEDAGEPSQSLQVKDERNGDALKEVFEREKVTEQSEVELGNLIAASFEDDEKYMEAQDDFSEREGDADGSRAAEEIPARSETPDADAALPADETIQAAEEAGPTPDLTPFQRTVLDCRAVIGNICREEFGVGVELDEQMQRLMDRQRERVGRSLQRLSEELYSKDTHFVLELIQNADDNDYEAGVEPSLVFLVDRSEVTVLNNEVGFSESNIRALCDIGRTTKGKRKRGYIGHKGIGFKSVFRVSDKPEITSNGYYICFDQTSDQMGYILPTWAGPEEMPEVAQMEEPRKPWTTRITLPLKGDVQRTASLVNKFEDVQPSLLLFLNRLQSIIIVNKEEKTTSHMSRTDKGGNVVEIRHSKTTDNWLLVKKCLDATKREGIESTELGLAFPLSDGTASEQNVFAFLPLRSYGFHFIIQGDFDIPSSREDVDSDSAWNQWLLQEIAPLFTGALETFKAHYHGDPIRAVCQFLKFVPMESQILTEFFRKVAANIHQRLKATPCMPVLAGQGEGGICWKLPSETLLCPDRSVRELLCELVPEDALSHHLSCSYLHPQVVSSVREVLLKSLGVKMLQIGMLMNILASVARDAQNREEPLSPKTVAQWMTCICRSRDRYDVSQGTLDQLRSIPMIPLSSGRVVTVAEGSVFFPISDEDSADQSQGRIPSAHSAALQALEEDMCTVDDRVLTSLDSVANSQVVQLLEELGVRRIRPRQVISHHILPVIQSHQWKDKSRDVLVGYVVYIKEQLARQPDVCDLDKIADCIRLVTNHGLIQPRERPVHFTVTYGNPVDLNNALPGCDWVLLDSCYIFHKGIDALQPNEAASWNAFFRKLGVLNSPAVEKRVVTLKVDELDVTPWADLGQFWEKPADGVYKIHDNACKEFEELVQANLERSTMQSQRQCLLKILDQEWNGYYSAFIGADVFDPSGTKLASTESSFAISLKTSSWLPSTPIREENTGHQVVFRKPNDIFIDSDRARELLGDHVSYLKHIVQGDAGPILQFIGLKSVGVVDVNFMIQKLKSWCGDMGQSPDLTSGTPFCTSLGHIIRVYDYLEQNCRPQELKELFSDHRVVFVPQSSMLQDYEVPVPGQFVHKSLVYWKDPSALLQRYDTLSRRAELCTLYPQNKEDFFRRQLNVDSMPTIKEYAQVLVKCTEDITLPDNTRIREEVLVLYGILGQKCFASGSSRHSQYLDRHAAGSVQQEPVLESSSVQFLKTILEGQAIFPTLGNRWVTAKDKPLIRDGRSTDIQKLFLDKKEVHLLNFGDRNRLGQAVEGLSGSVNQQYVDVFLQACGIEMLSECIKEEFITELTAPSSILQLFLHEVCPYIQLYMRMHCGAKTEFQSTYEKLTAEVNIAAKLKVIRFMSAKQIDKVYRFKHDPSVSANQRVDCGLHELSVFYIATGISMDLRHNSSVRREVAKLFSCGSTEVQEALFSFIGNLLLEMGSKREEYGGSGISEGVCRALGLTFPQEDDKEPWEVPKPFIPEQVVLKPTKVQPVREPTKPQLPAGSLLEGHDDAALRHWPPRSGTSSPHKVLQGGSREGIGSPHLHQPSTGGTVQARPAQAQQEGLSPEESSNDPTEKAQIADTLGELESTEEDSGQSSSSQRREVRDSSHDNMEGITAPETVKGEFSSPPQVQRSAALPHPSSGSTKRFFLPPHANREAMEVEFEDLAPGTAFLESLEGLTPPLGNNRDMTDIARWGEQLVYLYLRKQAQSVSSEASEVAVRWINQQDETGEPYDIVISQGTKTVYVEVKSTIRDQKQVVEISPRQVAFALEKGADFHLFRVFNVGNVSRVRLCRLQDLGLRMVKKEVKLFMYL